MARPFEALLLVAGFVAVGLIDYWVAVSGYADLSIVVWIVGYGGLVLIGWYRWLRPLDITGQ
ncbi:hypothetical protein VB773_01700 [Haloarculaceae archaeon H-GB2-1]|nr:hypothetical protein [Haloarculaceae archaeon H-GB1-1]MEA5388385.1 hypothetical protein [Haloarculaceae archaeon H-GB11]MEA5406421.1 hypothetical protein [Haloarculaceae archaeon H-GB2-1]